VRTSQQDRTRYAIRRGVQFSVRRSQAFIHDRKVIRTGRSLLLEVRANRLLDGITVQRPASLRDHFLAPIFGPISVHPFVPLLEMVQPRAHRTQLFSAIWLDIATPRACLMPSRLAATVTSEVVKKSTLADPCSGFTQGGCSGIIQKSTRVAESSASALEPCAKRKLHSARQRITHNRLRALNRN
jgi:hypothetical protein